MSNEITVVESGKIKGIYLVMKNGRTVGTMDNFVSGYALFPSRQTELSGDDYIAMGRELNKLNGVDNGIASNC